jgi:NADPH-dependent curcumin reductase CurA
VQVGGDITEAVLDNMAREGRVAICGMISQYDQVRPAPTRQKGA